MVVTLIALSCTYYSLKSTFNELRILIIDKSIDTVSLDQKIDKIIASKAVADGLHCGDVVKWRGNNDEVLLGLVVGDETHCYFLIDVATGEPQTETFITLNDLTDYIKSKQELVLSKNYIPKGELSMNVEYKNRKYKL